MLVCKTKNGLFAIFIFSFISGLLAGLAVALLANEDEKGASQKKSGLLFLPVIYYAPETHLAFGVAGLSYFELSKDESAKRPSNIAGLIVYTQRKQFNFELNPDFYLRGGSHLQTKLTYSDFPDQFYGIGNAMPAKMEEDYTSKNWRFSVEALKKFYRALNLGFQYFFDDTKVVKVKEGGLLASGAVSGSQGGKVSGLGYLITWDSRNSIFYATSGSFHQFSALVFGRTLGSDFTFSRFYFDLRKYLPFSPAHTLALHTRLLFQTGNPPFWRQAQLGGLEIMRGYYQGRYRDKNMICLQAEYRWVPLTWRLGLVGFVDVGDVADKVSHFDLGDFKYTYGFGIRYIFSKVQRLNIRLDVGFGKGTSGVYFNASEAF